MEKKDGRKTRDKKAIRARIAERKSANTKNRVDSGTDSEAASGRGRAVSADETGTRDIGFTERFHEPKYADNFGGAEI